MQSPERPAARTGAGDPPRLERMEGCPGSFFRYLYAEVGRAYHWTDRLKWSDEQVRAHLADPDVSLWLLSSRGAPAGYFELRRHERRVGGSGVLRAAAGVRRARVGGHLLTLAAREAWAMRPERVWLHTCTLDHPAALPNYLKRGFRPVRRGVLHRQPAVSPMAKPVHPRLAQPRHPASGGDRGRGVRRAQAAVGRPLRLPRRVLRRPPRHRAVGRRGPAGAVPHPSRGRRRAHRAPLLRRAHRASGSSRRPRSASRWGGEAAAAPGHRPAGAVDPDSGAGASRRSSRRRRTPRGATDTSRQQGAEARGAAGRRQVDLRKSLNQQLAGAAQQLLLVLLLDGGGAGRGDRHALRRDLRRGGSRDCTTAG